MKPLSFYSQKKRDKFLWIPVILIIAFVYACGPSMEEMQAKKMSPTQQENQQNRVVINTINKIDLYNLGNNEYSFIEIDKCEYIGGWSGFGNGGPFMSHKGNCKYCHKRDSLLIESILKRLLQVKK